MKMVRVKWIDSTFAVDPGWAPREDTVRTVCVVTVGIVHERKKNRIVLINSKQEDGFRVAGLQAISMSAVKSIKRLR